VGSCHYKPTLFRIFNLNLGYENGSLKLKDLYGLAYSAREPKQISGKQEYFKNLINQFV
jgi:xylose isomerase